MTIPSLMQWWLERLAPLGRLRLRRMFGAWGLYCDELFFAIVADDQLWLKVDEQTEARFQALGLKPVSFTAASGRVQTLRYYPLPDAALDDDAELLMWARLALAAALRSRAPRRASRS